MDLFSEKPRIFTVSELRSTINDLITEKFKGHILLRGVISSVPKLYPQFVFFDIKDESKNQFFTVFSLKNNFLRAETKLRDLGVVKRFEVDIPVMLIAKVSVSKQKQISLRIIMEDIVPDYTKSVLKNQKDITLEKLKEEGLLDKQKQIKIPRILRKIAIITSDQGTSLKDIRSSIAGAKKFIDIVFAPSRVEGTTAISQIIEIIEKLNKIDVDLIILARGGGSTVDLAVFNDYSLCRTVALSEKPIIVAIGHDKDELAVEYVSYKRPSPATPSGAGAYVRQLVLGNFTEFKDTFLLIHNLMNTLFDMYTIKVRENLLNIIRYLEYKFETELRQLSELLEGIVRDIKQKFDAEAKYLKLLIETLNAYNHRNVLSRGYALVWGKEKLIKKASEVEKYMEIEFIDSKIKVERKGS